MMQIINAARESDVRYAPDRGANPCMDQISSRALTTQHTRTQLSLRARLAGTHHSRLSKKRLAGWHVASIVPYIHIQLPI
jgi:hypothetical protein